MYNEEITLLKGADRVRKRPQVIFSNYEGTLAFNAFRMLINVLAREAIMGGINSISVVLSEDDSVHVNSFGCGMDLLQEGSRGKPFYEEIFCDFYPASLYASENVFEETEKYQNKLYGHPEDELLRYTINSDCSTDLCFVQFATEFMDVRSVKDGIVTLLAFENGELSGFRKRETLENELSGTFFDLRFAEEVFGEISLERDRLYNYLNDLAVTIPGLSVEVYDNKNNEKKQFRYDGGILDYCKQFANTPFINEIESTGRDRYNRQEYSAKVRLAVGFGKDRTHKKCYHNFRELCIGGTHLKGVLEKIEEEVNYFFNNKRPKGITAKKAAKALLDSLVLVIDTKCSYYSTNWADTGRQSIDNKMITDMATDLIGDSFYGYLLENKEEIFEIIKK